MLEDLVSEDCKGKVLECLQRDAERTDSVLKFMTLGVHHEQAVQAMEEVSALIHESKSTEKPMKYRKKPVEIEAAQWTGSNETVIAEFTKGSNRYIEFEGDICRIETLEGIMTASKGDFIIKGVKGEFYPCKPDIFDQTYERVE